ncbi:MAG: GNAT family N-acetyltransferase [Blastocatellia bacterium]
MRQFTAFIMQNGVTVEQMALSDRDKVLSFLRAAYSENPRQSNGDFWDWHFLKPPRVEPDRLPVWLAKSGDRIAGQLAAIPVELNVNDEAKRAIWILDLIVDPDFRRMGIAQKLVLAAEEYCPYMLGVNTNEQHAPDLLQKLGWRIVTKIPRFHRILFPGEAVREIRRYGVLRSTANLGFAPFRLGLGGGLRDGENVRILNEFDGSFDDLWRESNGQWPCSVSRSSDMLNWQFKQQPKKKFDILGYFENGKLLGYAILFFRRTNDVGSIDKAAISDICYHPGNPKLIVDSLLKASLRVATERRAGGLVTDTLDPLLQERLKHCGFWKVKSGLQLMAKTPENRDVVYDGSKWFLTRGDSDISIFEHPNV